MTASVAVVGVWLFLFNSNGLVNSILGPLAPDPSWLVNSKLAMPTIAIYVTWKQLGFFILLYLAALQNVSKDLYEAASMDGAGRWKSFLNVTVPGVRPATTLVVLLATVTGANLFTEPYLLTGGGGPDGASASPVLVMYQKGIEQGNPDIGSAIGVLLVIGVLLHRPDRTSLRREGGLMMRLRFVALLIGAFVFLFPFYYMLIGSLQAEPDPSVSGGVPGAGNLTGHNYGEINKAINLGQVAAELGHLHRRRHPRDAGLRRARGLRAGPAAVPRPRVRCST